MVYRCLEKTAGPPICNVSAEKKQRETFRRCLSKTSTICVPIKPINVCFVTINGGLALLVVCGYLAWLVGLLNLYFRVNILSTLHVSPSTIWFCRVGVGSRTIVDTDRTRFLIVSWLCDIGKRNTWEKSSFQTHYKHFERLYLNINHSILNQWPKTVKTSKIMSKLCVKSCSNPKSPEWDSYT